MEIVDFHTHVYPEGLTGFWRRPSSERALLAAMDDAGVRRAAVLAIEPFIPNEIVCDVARAHADRLVPIGSVDPRKDGAAAAVSDAVRRLGARAIKVHPRLQEFGLQQLDRIVPIAEACADERVPLVVCSFEGGPSLYVANILELCASLARTCPKTTIVLAHAGGHRPLEVFLMLKAFPNLMTDLSFSPIYYAGSTVAVDLEFLVRRSNPSQLLFGSDFPEASMKASIEAALALVERAGMTAADRDSVFSANAAALLRLDS